jgi:hypothetical protein
MLIFCCINKLTESFCRIVDLEKEWISKIIENFRSLDY